MSYGGQRTFIHGALRLRRNRPRGHVAGPDAPFGLRTITIAALARKGIAAPGPGTFQHTHKLVRGIMVQWETMGNPWI